MRWLKHLKRDPVPWLLDPLNPCVRTLTLRHIFNRTEEQLIEESALILTWDPIRKLLDQFTKLNFWGRADNPYFGGPIGTFGTLYMLAQLGVPNAPEIELACTNLLNQGRLADGRFSPGGAAAVPWMCHTGIVLQTLRYFGYGEMLLARSSWDTLVTAINTQPDLLDCSPLGHKGCWWGMVKALGALLSLPQPRRTEEDNQAIARLAESLVNQPYDFDGNDADWLRFSFPRYYASDLLELCHLLAQTSYRKHHRYQEFLQRVLALQTEKGTWIKHTPHPVFTEERINQPSRWLTFEATHTLILTYGGNTYAA